MLLFLTYAKLLNYRSCLCRRWFRAEVLEKKASLPQITVRGCGREDWELNKHLKSLLLLLSILAQSITCSIPNSSLVVKGSPHCQYV